MWGKWKASFLGKEIPSWQTARGYLAIDSCPKRGSGLCQYLTASLFWNRERDVGQVPCLTLHYGYLTLQKMLTLLHPILLCLTLFYPTPPYRTLPYPTLPYPTLPYLTLPYPTLPYPLYPTLPHRTVTYLTLPYPTPPYRNPTVPYFTPPYPTPPHLTPLHPTRPYGIVPLPYLTLPNMHVSFNPGRESNASLYTPRNSS